MQGSAESVSRTGETANTFGAKLGAMTQSLGAAGGSELATQVDGALACTAQLQGSVQALQAQLGLVGGSGCDVEQLVQLGIQLGHVVGLDA